MCECRCTILVKQKKQNKKKINQNISQCFTQVYAYKGDHLYIDYIVQLFFKKNRTYIFKAKMYFLFLIITQIMCLFSGKKFLCIMSLTK